METIQKPLLSISMLVSNNIETIEKCMESLKPLLQGFPCELVVVDTVGEEHTDGSLDVVRRYTDKIYRFEWCNDFAAARNFGLNKCTGEWFMFLDDDEWFEDVTEIVEFFRSGEYLQYQSASYRIRNYTNPEGSAWNMAVLARMVHRTPELRFVGSIHEAFSAMHLPCRDFSSFVHHYGYAYASEEERLSHVKRNTGLLKKELEKNPMNLRYRAQMAMELAVYDNDSALAFCSETFALCEKECQSVYIQWMMILVFRLHEALGTGMETIEATYRQLKQTYGFSETAENGICFQMVRLCLLHNLPEKAYPFAVTYFETYRILMENKELQQKQMSADSYRYQSDESYLEMLHFGAYSAWKAGAYEAAWQWYHFMPWEQEDFENEEAFQMMLGLVQEYTDIRTLLDILRRLLKNNRMMQKETVRKSVSELLSMLR